MYGGKLNNTDLQQLLKASYNPKDVNGFIVDGKASSKTTKVFHNPHTGQTVVAHMGTQGYSDWGNNAIYALGGKSAYKHTHRYKEAERTQRRAEAKYGTNNLSTIGHSQGGLQAEMLGNRGRETITLNKATRPFDNKKGSNQTDISTKGDIVSSLNPFQGNRSRDVVVGSKSYNPLSNHSIESLDSQDNNITYGQGIRSRLSIYVKRK